MYKLATIPLPELSSDIVCTKPSVNLYAQPPTPPMSPGLATITRAHKPQHIPLSSVPSYADHRGRPIGMGMLSPESAVSDCFASHNALGLVGIPSPPQWHSSNVATNTFLHRETSALGLSMSPTSFIEQSAMHIRPAFGNYQHVHTSFRGGHSSSLESLHSNKGDARASPKIRKNTQHISVHIALDLIQGVGSVVRAKQAIAAIVTLLVPERVQGAWQETAGRLRMEALNLFSRTFSRSTHFRPSSDELRNVALGYPAFTPDANKAIEVIALVIALLRMSIMTTGDLGVAIGILLDNRPREEHVPLIYMLLFTSQNFGFSYSNTCYIRSQKKRLRTGADPMVNAIRVMIDNLLCTT